jgi:hypothetical protein
MPGTDAEMKCKGRNFGRIMRREFAECVERVEPQEEEGSEKELLNEKRVHLEWMRCTNEKRKIRF